MIPGGGLDGCIIHIRRMGGFSCNKQARKGRGSCKSSRQRGADGRSAL